MDHLGIQKFFFMGYCIGGPFALKLLEQAPDRVVVAVLCQPVGYRPENPRHVNKSGKDVWAPELLARRPELNMTMVDKYLHDLYRVRARLRVCRAASRGPARPRCWSSRPMPRRARTRPRRISPRWRRTPR